MKVETRKSLVRGFVVWLGIAGYALQKYVGGLESLADWNWFEFSKGALEIALVGVAMLVKFFGGDMPERVTEKPDPDAPLFGDDAYRGDSKPATARTQDIDIPRLRAEIKADEGYRVRIYKDSTANATVGIGHKLIPEDPEFKQLVGSNVSVARIEQWFNQDIINAIADARSVVKDFDRHPRIVKHGLVNMAFNLGRSGLDGFNNMISLIDRGSYAQAAAAGMNSLWADQVGKRATRVTAMISNGEPEYQLA